MTSVVVEPIAVAKAFSPGHITGFVVRKSATTGIIIIFMLVPREQVFQLTAGLQLWLKFMSTSQLIIGFQLMASKLRMQKCPSGF